MASYTVLSRQYWPFKTFLTCCHASIPWLRGPLTGYWPDYWPLRYHILTLLWWYSGISKSATTLSASVFGRSTARSSFLARSSISGILRPPQIPAPTMSSNCLLVGFSRLQTEAACWVFEALLSRAASMGMLSEIAIPRRWKSAFLISFTNMPCRSPLSR